jgi:hypothetical protein
MTATGGAGAKLAQRYKVCLVSDACHLSGVARSATQDFRVVAQLQHLDVDTFRVAGIGIWHTTHKKYFETRSTTNAVLRVISKEMTWH